MLFLTVGLATLVAFQFANGVPLQDDKIEPIDMSYYCVYPFAPEPKSGIVLIHGIGSSSHTWDDVWNIALKTSRTLCAVDLRNHGNSPWNDRTDVAAWAVDIGHFLDSQKMQTANLIGHSLGGKIALHYALNNPTRVNSLIVEDMRPNGVTEGGAQLVKVSIQLLVEAIETVPDGSTEDEARAIIVDYLNENVKKYGVDEHFDTRTAKGIAILCDGGKCKYRMNVDIIQKIVGDLPAYWATSSGLYEKPSLFIYGTHSVINVHDDKDNILKLFPNANFVGIENATHQMHGKYQQFSDEVVKFLNNLES